MDMEWIQTSQTRKLSMAESLSLLFHVLILLLEKLSDEISLSKVTPGDGHGHLFNSGYTDGTVDAANYDL
jgi:hypothetical protein